MLNIAVTMTYTIKKSKMANKFKCFQICSLKLLTTFPPFKDNKNKTQLTGGSRILDLLT